MEDVKFLHFFLPLSKQSVQQISLDVKHNLLLPTIKFTKTRLIVSPPFAFASCDDSDEMPMDNTSLIEAATDAGLTMLLSAVGAVPGLSQVAKVLLSSIEKTDRSIR